MKVASFSISFEKSLLEYTFDSPWWISCLNFSMENCHFDKKGFITIWRRFKKSAFFKALFVPFLVSPKLVHFLFLMPLGQQFL